MFLVYEMELAILHQNTKVKDVFVDYIKLDTFPFQDFCTLTSEAQNYWNELLKKFCSWWNAKSHKFFK